MTDIRTDATTRTLLACGVTATPLFFAVAFAQIAAHENFDLGRHMISQLATGDQGWVQIANFVVTGALFVLAAVGIRRALPTGPGTPASPGRMWAPRLIGAFGAGLVAAGVLVPDPVNGYPTAATGPMTWHGIGHGIAALVSGLAMVAAALVFARRFAADGHRGRAVLSAVIGLVYLVLPWVNPGQAGLLLAVASVIGWGWISVIAGRLMAGHAGTVHAAAQVQHA